MISHVIALYLVAAVQAQWQIIDDSSGTIQYEGDGWNIGATSGFSEAFDGTLHFSNAANANYQFSFTGTDFQIYLGKKRDRGVFHVVVDNVRAGDGDAWSAGSIEEASSVQFQVFGLQAGPHTVVVSNSVEPDSRLVGTIHPFLVLDYIQVEQTNATSSSAATSTKQTVASSQNDKHAKSSSKGGIIGGVVAAVLVLFLFGAALAWYRRRQKKRTVSDRSHLETTEDDSPPRAAIDPYTMEQILGEPASAGQRASLASFSTSQTNNHLYSVVGLSSPPLTRNSFASSRTYINPNTHFSSNRISNQYTPTLNSPQMREELEPEQDAFPGQLPPSYAATSAAPYEPSIQRASLDSSRLTPAKGRFPQPASEELGQSSQV